MKWLRNLNAATKLLVAFGAMLLFSLPIGYLAMSWWLRGFAYHIDPSPLSFLGAAAAAVVIALATVATQSIMVARAKPVMALRYE